ncbi:MAG: hypothetical protein HFE85_01055 [Clostridiales bacterium]|nr:hypothetical protein [Clostridiales bacterium]
MKRILCLLLAASLLLVSFSGCDNEPDSPPAPASSSSSEAEPDSSAEPELIQKEIILCYNSQDSLNPYRCTSKLNSDLATLLYDSLVTLDGNLAPTKSMAQEISLDKTVCTVTLRDGLKFSDGSAVTAADVVYSATVASESGRYQKQLASVSSVEESGGAVVFHLSGSDPYFENLLDFPIVKTGSAGENTPPVGSGRYVYANGKLTANHNHTGTAPTHETVTLTEGGDYDTMFSSLDIGAVTCVIDDLASGKAQRTSGTALAMPMPNLVFLGANLTRGHTAQPAVRRAISAALDRTLLGSAGYSEYYQPAVTPFLPGWTPAKDNAILKNTSNYSEAANLLKEGGYSQKEESGPAANADGELALELIVNEDNFARVQTAQSIATQLSACGIRITVISLPFDEYSSRIERGNYDLYLGEMKLLSNMSLTPLLPENTESRAAYAKLRAGEMEMSAFLDAFAAEMPLIPILYRSGMIAVTRSMGSEIRFSFSNPYGNLEEWLFYAG